LLIVDVEFYSKNKIEKLVHLVRIYHDSKSPERQIPPDVTSCRLAYRVLMRKGQYFERWSWRSLWERKILYEHYFNTCTVHLVLSCTMTNKCTV